MYNPKSGEKKTALRIVHINACPGTPCFEKATELPHPHDMRMQQPTGALLTKTELCNDSTVSFDIVLLKICKKVSSVTDHFEKSAS